MLPKLTKHRIKKFSTKRYNRLYLWARHFIFDLTKKTVHCLHFNFYYSAFSRGLTIDVNPVLSARPGLGSEDVQGNQGLVLDVLVFTFGYLAVVLVLDSIIVVFVLPWS